MISNYYNDSLLRRYTFSINASDTKIFYDCGTNNVLISEGKSLGCIHHVVIKCFKHTSMSGRGNHDNTNKSQVTLIVCIYTSMCISTHMRMSVHMCSKHVRYTYG